CYLLLWPAPIQALSANSLSRLPPGSLAARSDTFALLWLGLHQLQSQIFHIPPSPSDNRLCLQEQPPTTYAPKEILDPVRSPCEIAPGHPHSHARPGMESPRLSLGCGKSGLAAVLLGVLDGSHAFFPTKQVKYREKISYSVTYAGTNFVSIITALLRFVMAFATLSSVN